MPSFISYVNFIIISLLQYQSGDSNGLQRYVIHYKSQRKSITFLCRLFLIRGLKILFSQENRKNYEDNGIKKIIPGVYGRIG